MTTAPYRVDIFAPDGRRSLVAFTEREVALKAESLLAFYKGNVLSVGFTVTCHDPEAARRIAFYLTDVSRELELI
ncbi:MULTISPECIES: hypothetical protein [unclassified Methylobacterium]|jgi:hypothetical protein|uniref:hypothetical protein n=1 Tax=unclassified Methylobacterium TaxID=2615210 RepID=UPI0007005601|nr:MULTISPECIES: hypothetical protein [unclassified Methylobacterium]KQO54415.1 hypothetical protein ASF24_21560 [Methylobacterium sp. Leaf86]KQO90394.1 hypothetical protein ASF32_05375 [Methylobacterium sp. Leaf91]MBO1018905.1 hypothetical protein [Methylobacterium sp. SD274]